MAATKGVPTASGFLPTAPSSSDISAGPSLEGKSSAKSAKQAKP